MRSLPHKVLRQLLRRVPPSHLRGNKGVLSSCISLCGLRSFGISCHLRPAVIQKNPPKNLSVFLHQELSHKGRYWHEECFRCAKCYKPLAKEPFSTKDDRIMCGKCCSREDAPRCHGCYKPILAGTTDHIHTNAL